MGQLCVANIFTGKQEKKSSLVCDIRLIKGDNGTSFCCSSSVKYIYVELNDGDMAREGGEGVG